VIASRTAFIASLNPYQRLGRGITTEMLKCRATESIVWTRRSSVRPFHRNEPGLLQYLVSDLSKIVRADRVWPMATSTKSISGMRWLCSSCEDRTIAGDTRCF
jgi:hypothetical protein